MNKVDKFINDLLKWAEKENNVEGIALVGSYATGKQRPDSDVDIVIIAGFPEVYLLADLWIEKLGEVKSIHREDWGMVQAKRVFYENGLEVEFGITWEEWAKIDPVNLGTKRVVKNGMKILMDKKNHLTELVETIKG